MLLLELLALLFLILGVPETDLTRFDALLDLRAEVILDPQQLPHLLYLATALHQCCDLGLGEQYQALDAHETCTGHYLLQVAHAIILPVLHLLLQKVGVPDRDKHFESFGTCKRLG